MEDLETIKQKVEELRDQAKRDCEVCIEARVKDQSQYSFYYGRQMAFIECINIIKSVVLDYTVKLLEEVENEEN